MSVPTIVVSPSNIPTSFQIATPFSFGISNSDVYRAPIRPSFTTTMPSQVSIQTTSPYSPENALISAIPDMSNQSFGISNVTGNSRPTSVMCNSEVFEVQLPYPPSGMTGGSMSFISGFGIGFNNNGTTPGWGVSLNGVGTTYPYHSNDTFQCTYDGGNSFTLVIKRPWTTDVTLGTFTAYAGQFILSNLAWNATSSPVNFTVVTPDIVNQIPATYPYLVVSSLTSPQISQFITGSGTTLVVFESTAGYQSVLSNLYFRVDQIYNGSSIGSYTVSNINVSNIAITVTPSLSSQLSLVTYQPFSYTYSIPSDVVNVVLQSNSNATTASLAPYIAPDGTSFSSDIGFTSPGISYLEIDAILNGITVLTSNSTIINTSLSLIIATPAIPSGSLNLYKYEPFSYVFTVNPLCQGLVIQFSRSSSELQSFCTLSSDSQTITFAGTFNVSYSTTLSLVLDLISDGSTVSTTTILIQVNPGRFFPPTANQNFQLYQYENISNTFGSNLDFLTVQAIDSIVIVPTIPSGLSFGGSCNTFYLQGTPRLQTTQSNYQVIGSNSSNGRIVTTNISIRVNPQIVRINPSYSSLTGLVVDTQITPITTTTVKPQETIYSTSFVYSWTGLPDGFSFQDINGNTFPLSNAHPYTPPDEDLTIVLVGAPSLAFANSLAASGGNLYQVRLTGIRTDQTGKQTTGSSLFNFSLAETVLINVSNSVLLYQSKPLGANDVVITAGSFFSSSTISNVIADSLPPGLSLVQYTSPTIYHLVGTPTTVNLTGSYTFSATNYNGNSRSTTVTIPINPDVITFTGNTPADGTEITFIVSRPLTSAKTGYYTTPIGFTATSTAAATPIVYSASIDLVAYGLALNSSTGALTGIPTVPLSQTTVTISATDVLGTVGTTTIILTISADVFTWPSYSPILFQNRTMTPYQFIMTSTLSERTIQAYSSANLPTGMTISPSGLLSGAPTVYVSTGTFNIIATTGYSTVSQLYTYSMIIDNVLTLQSNSVDTISNVFSNVLFRSIQYSTNSVVNPTYTITTYPIQNPSPTFALSSSGNFSGNFTGTRPYSTYLLDVTASNGTLSSTTPSQICVTVNNAPVTDMFVAFRKPNGARIEPQIQVSSNYIFQASTNGQKLIASQTFDEGDGFVIKGLGSADPRIDMSALGSTIITTGLTISNVYVGTVLNGHMVWGEDIELLGRGNIYHAVANDGSNWLIVSDDGRKFVLNARASNDIFWTSSRGAGAADTFTFTNECVLTYEPTSSNVVFGAGTSIITLPASQIYVGDANWQTSTFSGFTLSRIALSNSTLVAIGSGAASGSPMSISTNGGATWTRITISTPTSFIKGTLSPNFTDILYANGKWVMCGQNNAGTNFIAYTNDLSNWTIYNNPTTMCTAIAFNGNAWTIANSSGNLFSLDAGPWPTQTTSTQTTTFAASIDKMVCISNSSAWVANTVFIPGNLGYSFSTPTQSKYILYQYVPYSFDFTVLPFNSFIYYYATNIPIGFSFLLDPTGSKATLTGISPSNNSTQQVEVYARTATSSAVSFVLSFSTVTPFFINPQSGAGAYTAILRNDVEANAAQNARDHRTFPQVDPLAGPLMAPRAPDVTTPDDCALKLCKKPCPACHSM